MEMNEPDTSLSRRQEKNLLKVAKAVARNEFVNPQREGCPDSETLNLLARRRPSLAESADLIDHIGTCSPCFNEYSRCRAAYKRGIRITYALASVAAVLFLAVVVSRSWHSPRARPAVPPTIVARSPMPAEQAIPRVLDLRMKGVSRGDTPKRQLEGDPLQLPRVKLSLSILLPIGSEDGMYDVALIGSSDQPLLTATGSAKLQDFVEVLPVMLNLSDLAPGPYELRIRHVKAQWNAYPISLE
jgi:hypothetical protein